MADHAAVTIPLEDIQRIQIYINRPKKTVAQIKAATGADYILNGTLYNLLTGAVNCHLKADGQVYARPDYTVYGYGWNEGADIAMMSLPSPAVENYIACTPLLMHGRKMKLIHDVAQGARRGRSALGMKDGRLALYCSKDGSSAAITPQELQDDLLSAGWDSAVMLDGGGSAQCDFDGVTVTSSRKVQHLLLIYTKKASQETPIMTQQEGEESDMNGASVKAYSKAKDGTKKLSTHFKVKEFACSDGADPIIISPDLVNVLQKIRTHFGKPVTINSAFRTASHNKAVGGAAYSQHLYGMAADIVVKDVKPKAVAAYAEKLLPNSGGIGIYSTFTHVDVRKVKSRWNG